LFAIVWVVPLGKWDFRRTIQSEERETCIKYVDQALATLQKRMRESSVESGREVTQFVLIGDCEHFSYSQLLSFGCKTQRTFCRIFEFSILQRVNFFGLMRVTGIETLIELARHFDSNYPEFLSKAYLINCMEFRFISFLLSSKVSAILYRKRLICNLVVAGSSLSFKGSQHSFKTHGACSEILTEESNLSFL